MRKLVIIISLVFTSLRVYSQTTEFHIIEITSKKEISIETKDYNSYDLGDFILYIGFNTNNLKAMIKSKTSDDITFKYDQTASDAMIVKPQFFESSNQKIIVIMLELASEYSWGQEVVLIKDDKVYDCGFLDYMANEDNGESIAKYAQINLINGQLILTFQPKEFIDNRANEKIINAKTLKFILTENGLLKAK